MSAPVSVCSYTGASSRAISRGGMRRLSFSFARTISSPTGVSTGSSSVSATRRKLGPRMFHNSLAPMGLASNPRADSNRMAGDGTCFATR